MKIASKKKLLKFIPVNVEKALQKVKKREK
jgi:hypothetical protein